jgi:hypothetical protein
MAISSSTLTKDLLNSLARGIATTKILPGAANGAVTMSSLSFTTAGLIYSIEGSLSIEWAEPTLEELKVDQGQQSIAVDIEKGDITFSANYPTIAQAALTEFFDADSTSVTVTADASHQYQGKGIFLTPKQTEVTMMIEDQDQEWAIIFARVSLTARLVYDSDNRIWYIGLNGRILSNLADGQPDALIIPKKSGA